ncbi:hypothetical protein [Pseudoxanthomonas dokdonensis]|uniref:Uncharacterized protein n=1 Tax=Pseudoxanthomonas dokdonensis TaxID=344882 RepID=A0A0R0CHB0_9GAMM|nr:hypothetical protein [Pseudoxanthomonas dokdonensis]KRG68502.1 hypothetical protein ABB29_12850 [Pseudoxanthomonas dokdonensis]
MLAADGTGTTVRRQESLATGKNRVQGTPQQRSSSISRPHLVASADLADGMWHRPMAAACLGIEERSALCQRRRGRADAITGRKQTEDAARVERRALMGLLIMGLLKSARALSGTVL